jgi:ATP/maltotriose-dependent transcriptional regulator MalT
MPDHLLELGRQSYGRRAWRDAFAQLTAADARTPLAVDDLERLARAAQLIGQDGDGEAFWERAHHEALRVGDRARAARCAFWLGMALMTRDEFAQSSGWFARGQRLLTEGDLDVPEQGYLLVPVALQALYGGDASIAHPMFRQVGEIGARFGDPDLITMGRLGCGQTLIQLGRVPEGVALLDDAMVAVLAEEVSPITAGIVYCGVIGACQQIFDLRRAGEWSEALSRWCEAQPDLVPFRGQCLVHRAEIMRLRGAWSAAFDEVQRASAVVNDSRGRGVIAAAAYERAELHRLRGELAEAEDAYRLAGEFGHEPQPGLALLRLAQGRLDAAAAAIRRVVAETDDRLVRSSVLAAYVDIMLEVDDLEAAGSGARELSEVASELDGPFLDATAAYAAGAVALAHGDARAAIGELRRALAGWRELDAPYEAARARAAIGVTCRLLGDGDGAAMALDSARRTFEELGAVVELSRLDELVGPSPRPDAGGLTGREVEVLQLVATGKTNRQVADALIISEKTVARHLSNIFVKLGVSSRAAATAYAYQHGLA